jgi:hypothetical protein
MTDNEVAREIAITEKRILVEHGACPTEEEMLEEERIAANALKVLAEISEPLTIDAPAECASCKNKDVALAKRLEWIRQENSKREIGQ